MKQETFKKIMNILPFVFVLLVLLGAVLGFIFAIKISNDFQKEKDKREIACFGTKNIDSFTHQVVNVAEDKYNCCEWKVNLVNNTYVNEKKCWALIQ